MPHVMGIDQSVQHTGISILNEARESVYLGLIEPPSASRDVERLAFIRDELNNIISPYDILVNVMEGYSYNSVNKKFLLGEVGCIVKLATHDKGAQLHIAAPTQLKKFACHRSLMKYSGRLVLDGMNWIS
jgi:Holliday junction resolvasome RuvABC endonuclease subunit